MQAVRERILKQVGVGSKRWGKYAAVNLSLDGQRRLTKVHRLVAAAFLGLSTTEQVNHKNGVKTDNRSVNLEPASSLTNIRHSVATGLRDTSGERNRHAALSADDVRIIRLELRAGRTHAALARRFGVQPACISKIATGRTWRHAA